MSWIRIMVLAEIWFLSLASVALERRYETAVRNLVEERLVWLSNPEKAALAHCKRSIPPTSSFDCRLEVTWRRDESYVSLCADRPAPGDRRFRSHRYYRLSTRCQVAIAGHRLVLRLLEVKLFR